MTDGCRTKLCEYRPSPVRSSDIESPFGTPARTYDPSPPGGICVGRVGFMFVAFVDPPEPELPHPAPTTTATAATKAALRLNRFPPTVRPYPVVRTVRNRHRRAGRESSCDQNGVRAPKQATGMDLIGRLSNPRVRATIRELRNAVPKQS